MRAAITGRYMSEQLVTPKTTKDGKRVQAGSADAILDLDITIAADR